MKKYFVKYFEIMFLNKNKNRYIRYITISNNITGMSRIVDLLDSVTSTVTRSALVTNVLKNASF